MPKFMDFHDHLLLPAETLELISKHAKSGVEDQFGVRQVELFHNVQGNVYCLVEAPNEEAVRRHHEAMGVRCRDVHEVQSLL